jgi:iron(III) transport system substrate-binding protein
MPIVGVLALVGIVGLLAWPPMRGSADESLVVYCAHDAEFAERILRGFERQTGISLIIRYDTEATKSLGLTNLILQERDHPQCDIFWNNQTLTTQQLQDEGLLVLWKGAGYERIPAQFKDDDGYWTGFAARLRVYIVNTDRMPADEKLIDDRLAGDLSRVAIAKPLFGTTLVHYSLLWREWGGERLQAWHSDLRQRGIREVPGNGPVKNLVADGACDFGFTDTDDAFAAVDSGKPVDMLPIRIDGRTICIPNSVAIIRGSRKVDAARKLVDYLLSAQTELELAKSAARQIPLGPVNESELPEEVRRLKTWAADGYDLRQLSTARVECLRWLRSEYLQ